MEINIKHILIFKTNIRTPEDKCAVAKIMEAHQICNWTVDQDDIDCVLRIVSPTWTLEKVISLLVSKGYQCEELT